MRSDDSALTVTLANLGHALLRTRQLDRAAAVLAEGLAVGERRGDIWGCVMILGGQSALEFERGDLPRARQALRRSLVLHRDLADPRYIAQALEACAWLAVAEDDAEQAARLLGAAGRLRETIGVPILSNLQREYDHYVPLARARIGDSPGRQPGPKAAPSHNGTRSTLPSKDWSMVATVGHWSLADDSV